MHQFSPEYPVTNFEVLDAAGLLRRLRACGVGCDAPVDPVHDAPIVPEVVAVPGALFTALQDFLVTLPDAAF